MDGRWLLADLLRLFKLSITPNRLIQFFLPAGCAQSARPAGPTITLPFLRLYIYIYVRPHLSRAQ